MGKRGKVDFKDVLSDPEFAVFARLRALRKEKADAEGVPAYALFTNDQLAEMVQRRVGTVAALRDDRAALARRGRRNTARHSLDPRSTGRAAATQLRAAADET